MLNDKGKEIAMNSIEIVDLSKFVDACVHQLSHGMKKECRIESPTRVADKRSLWIPLQKDHRRIPRIANF